jgi:predicted enzyme related to lactoylglutathione lyase
MAIDAVVYAKDLGVVAAFYEQVLSVTPLAVQTTHVLLPIGNGRLWIHAIPAEYSATIEIAQPPQLREETPIKLSLPVSSLTAARRTAMACGGGVAASDRAWEYEGTWHLDAWDPEGNVLQLRAPSN